VIINMTTIASRQTHYIDRTLESLFQSDGRDVAVNLILGSFDTSHVEKYRGVANIVPWDDHAQSRACEDNPRRNCTLNAIRALEYGEDEQCLCCEDDIEFDPNWLSQLLATVDEIPDDEYVLNLAHGKGNPVGTRYAVFAQSYLCGAQGLFYPTKRLRERVALYVELKKAKGMNDKLVGDYAMNKAALYNTIPRLVTHIGQVSAIRSLRKHGAE
jgi:hypothetical protein